MKIGVNAENILALTLNLGQAGREIFHKPYYNQNAQEGETEWSKMSETEKKEKADDNQLIKNISGIKFGKELMKEFLTNENGIKFLSKGYNQGDYDRYMSTSASFWGGRPFEIFLELFDPFIKSISIIILTNTYVYYGNKLTNKDELKWKVPKQQIRAGEVIDKWQQETSGGFEVQNWLNLADDDDRKKSIILISIGSHFMSFYPIFEEEKKEEKEDKKKKKKKKNKKKKKKKGGEEGGEGEGTSEDEKE